MSVEIKNEAVSIRKAIPEDAAACGQICFDAFGSINAQHNFPPDMPSAEFTTGLFEILLNHPGFYVVVGEIDGNIVGSNCLDERGHIAGVGPITIDPAAQNAGIGRRLMQAVLTRAQERGSAGVRLVQAAYHSRSLALYTKLGFAVREPLAVMQGAPLLFAMEGCTVRPATLEDVPACNAICGRVHGHLREGELLDAIAQGTARVVQRRDRISGYATGLAFFSHAVGEAVIDIQALIASAESFEGPGILVPTRQTELFQWCLDNGLRVTQPMTLMTMGLYNDPQGAWLPSILF